MRVEFDGFEIEDEFRDDRDTQSILASIDSVIKKLSPQEAYDWLNDLEEKIMDRTEELAANPEVKG